MKTRSLKCLDIAFYALKPSLLQLQASLKWPRSAKEVRGARVSRLESFW